jgi:hypothetical protein
MPGDVCTTTARASWHAQCALPAGSRFDIPAHTRIMQQVHEHISRPEYTGSNTCEGPGGDLFFVMRHYRALLHRATDAVPAAEPKKIISRCVGAPAPALGHMSSPAPAVPAAPAAPAELLEHAVFFGPAEYPGPANPGPAAFSAPAAPPGPAEAPASPTSATHSNFSGAYSEVLVYGNEEQLDDLASECCPDDSASQTGAPASVAIDIDYYQTMRFGPRVRETRADTDTQSFASTSLDENVISAEMLASIRNIELNVERLFQHVDRLHAGQAARPRPQRPHAQHPLPHPHPLSHPHPHQQYQFTAAAQSHGEGGTRQFEKHRGRGRGNARHSQHRTPESYAYAN